MSINQGQRTLQISDGRFVAVGDAGSEVFQRIASGSESDSARGLISSRAGLSLFRFL